MKYFNRILLILVFSYSCFGTIILNQILHDYPLSYPAGGKWTLVWDDDFNGQALDQTKWLAVDCSRNYSSYRRETQAVSDKSASVKSGCLILASKREQWKKSDNHYDLTHYTSGQAVTDNKYAWTYGRFEIRAKLPVGQGLLSYVSLRPVDGKLSQEILTTMMSGHDSYTIFMNNHWGTDQLRHYLEEDISGRSNLDFSASFHTFVIEWEPMIIRWYVDDIKMYQTDRNVPEIPLSLALGTTVNPFDDAKFDGGPIALTPSYIINWVRVYQRR